jgi:23S rRNA pseudouridine1911/1915/1917 synthase
VKSDASLKIIFQDDDILVVDKPAGWVVNRAETTKNQPTVQDWIERKKSKEDGVRGKSEIVRMKPTERAFNLRAGLVHRLDKETSGLLLIAKTPASFQSLQGQFKQRKVLKRYLALVHGRVEPRKGVIEAAIARSPFNRKKFGIFLGGRPARTEYKVSKYWQCLGETCSLLELRPATGRTHQIRVHMKYLGHPVVADEKYAGGKTFRTDRKWCGRQFLHAESLSFTHPKTGERIEFFSPLPEDLEQALKNCQLITDC